MLDFGGVYDSYCVDLTRTVSIGPANGRTREVYGAVLEAHDRAVAAVRPGVSRFAIDGRRATRSAVTDWRRRSGTEPGTAWASKCTRIRESHGAAREHLA